MARLLRPVWSIPTATEEEWNTTDIPIDNGHLIYSKDKNQIKIGNGKDLYTDLKSLERMPVISLIASTGPNGEYGTELHPLRFAIHNAFLARFEILAMDKYVITDYDSYTGYDLLRGRKLIVLCDDQESYDKITKIGHIACTSKNVSVVIKELLILQADGLVIGSPEVYDMFMEHASQIYHGVYSFKNAANIKEDRFAIPDTFELKCEDRYIHEDDYEFMFYARK